MQFFYTFHMPMLFMISGYFINFQKSRKDFIKNKFQRLIIPYWFCCAVMIFIKTYLSFIHSGVPEAAKILAKWFYISLYGSGNDRGSWYPSIGPEGLVWVRIGEVGMLWYLLALFTGSIIVRLLYKKRHGRIWIAAISILGIVSSRIIWLPFSLQNGMAVSFWIMLGAEVRSLKLTDQTDILRKNKKLNYTLLAVCILFWGISTIFGKTHLYENEYKLWIIDILGSVGASVVIYLAADRICKDQCYISKPFCWIGKNSMAIYSVHFWEDKVCPASKFTEWIGMNGAFAMASEIVIIIVLCIGATLIMGRFRLIKNLLGIQNLN